MHKIKTYLAIALLFGAFLTVTLPIAFASPHIDIDVSTAWNMMTSGQYPNIVILDVRNQSEYDTGYIPKAMLMPLWQLPQRIGELSFYKNSEMIVYCRSGARSQNASVILDANGFTKVYDMTGGLTAWNSSGYPVWTRGAGYTEELGALDGVPYAVQFPDAWNGGLILICRGFSLTPMTTPKTGSYNFGSPAFRGRGYAYAASMFAPTGFCVQQGVNSTYRLTKYLIDTYNIRGKVFLIGFSMGGGIACLLAEKYPTLYSGVVDLYGMKNLTDQYNRIARWVNLSDAALTAELAALGSPAPPPSASWTNLTGYRDFLKTNMKVIEDETGGTPATKPKAYEDRSPVYNANISLPVVTYHGTIDAVVPYYESLMYQAAVANAGRSNLYRLYPVANQPHGSAAIGAAAPFDELVAWSEQLRPSLRASAFCNVTVLPGWTWGFFAHSVNGKGPLTCQWYEGPTPMQGQTSPVLAVTKTVPGMYIFYCRITDTDGTWAGSNAVTLTVIG